MNTTDYFTNINAMFLFCIFTCGSLVWAVIRGYILKGKLTKEQDSHLKATNTNTLLNKALSAKNASLQANEHKLRDAEKKVRDLQGKLDHAESDRIELRAERATLENKLMDALAKVRKRDKDGKFLPSGNARVRTVKKLKLVTDLGENEVIHCPTLPEAEAICKLMDDAGLRWNNGLGYEVHNWKGFKERTYYYPSKGWFGDLQYLESNHTIHPASDFIARPKRVKKVKSDLPKLIHGLTVKNPTEDEAKMIFDEARRLGIESSVSRGRVSKQFPNIWYCEGERFNEGVCDCSGIFNRAEIVTAKEFVQRMQNGRG